ncbi:MAG: DUF4199 domain-containing protein [Clostridium sp.]|nr:DUF4199 domain-containing protein [Clostridium sp.]
MTAFDYKEARSYTARNGLAVGGMWIASFSLFIMGLHNPLAGNLSLIAGVGSVVLAGWIVRSYRRMNSLNTLQAFWMSFNLYLYASLLMAAAQYVYFRYLDNGMLMAAIETVMDTPEYKEMMKKLMPDENTEDVMTQALDNFRAVTPIQLTMSLLFNNFILGLMLCLPTSLIGMTGKSDNKPNN